VIILYIIPWLLAWAAGFSAMKIILWKFPIRISIISTTVPYLFMSLLLVLVNRRPLEFAILGALLKAFGTHLPFLFKKLEIPSSAAGFFVCENGYYTIYPWVDPTIRCSIQLAITFILLKIFGAAPLRSIFLATFVSGITSFALFYWGIGQKFW